MFFKISAFFFSYFAAIGVYVIFLPKMLDDLGYLPWQIGFVFAAVPLLRFITPFLFLKLLELNSKIFNLSLLIAVVCSFLFYFTIENFYLFLCVNLFLGISFSFMLPYVETISLKQLGKNSYGKARLYGSISFMVVGILLAKNLDGFGDGLNFFFIFMIFSAIFGLLISKNERENELETKKIAQNQNNEKFSILKNYPFWISIFLLQVSFGAFYNFFTIYQSDHGVDLETISYLWAFGVICEIIMLYFQGFILKKFDLYSIVKFSTLISSLRWLLLYLFPANIFFSFASQGIHAFSFALYHTAAIAYIYEKYENKKLAGQFYYGFSFGLGAFFGAIISGATYGDKLFLISALMALASFVALLIKNKDCL